METSSWLGLGILVWSFGFLARVFGAIPGGESIEIPRWLSFMLVSRGGPFPVPSLFFQLWGILTVIYGLSLDKVISDKMIGLIVGILLPVLITGVIIDRLRR